MRKLKWRRGTKFKENFVEEEEEEEQGFDVMTNKEMESIK